MITLLTLAASLFASRVPPPPARLAVPASVAAPAAAPLPAPSADAEKVEAEDEEGCG